MWGGAVWQTFITAFVTVFIAELGDKTQLAALALGSESGKKWAVFFGASLALMTTTALAIVAAEMISKNISPLMIKRGSGFLFIVLGILALRSSFTK